MADYIGKSRTNVFTVEPEKYEAMLQWARQLGLRVQVRRSAPPQQVTLLCDDSWPNYDPTDENMELVEFADQIRRWAQAGQVVILIEAGHEGLRYVGGSAVAVNTTDGSLVRLDLVNDIMARCEAMWPAITVPKPHEP